MDKTKAEKEVQEVKAMLNELKNEEEGRPRSIKKGDSKKGETSAMIKPKEPPVDVKKLNSSASKPDSRKETPVANSSTKKTPVDRKKSTAASIKSQNKELERIKKEEEAEIKRARKLEIERRILLATFSIAVITSFIFLIALTAEFWVTVEFPVSVLVLRNETSRGVTFYKTGHYHGLWKICRKEYYNDTEIKPDSRVYCQAIYHYPQASQMSATDRAEIDDVIMHFRRSCCAIGLLAFFMSFVAHIATWYSLHRMRYVYKRLAGVLHLLTGACCWVTVEVFKRSMTYEKDYLKEKVPPNSTIDFGFCYYLGWICFVLFVLTGLVLLVCSRKRKGGKARCPLEADENEPVNIGRI